METIKQPALAKMNPITTRQKAALDSFWSGSLVWEVDMADYSTLKSGGKATALIDVSSKAELQLLLGWLGANNIGWRIIGRGSNILVSESGFSGVIIRLQGDFKAITQEQPSRLQRDAEAKDKSWLYAGGGEPCWQL